MQRGIATAGAVFVAVWAVILTAQRLPGSIVPDHYDIHFAPDFATDTFSGRVSISVRVASATRSITLNAAEIDFHDISVTAGGSTQAATVAVDQERETATLTLPRSVPAGAAIIAIRYTGLLNNKLRG